MIRVARGTTEIEGFDLDARAASCSMPRSPTRHLSARIPTDLQMRTQDPNTLCTAYRGDGTVPLPSILVQSYYAGSIP